MTVRLERFGQLGRGHRRRQEQPHLARIVNARRGRVAHLLGRDALLRLRVHLRRTQYAELQAQMQRPTLSDRNDN